MGRLALGIAALAFGALVGVAAAQSTATTTTTSRTITTKLTTTVTEPPKTTTATRTETVPAKTVTTNEPTTRTNSVTVSTTPTSKSSSGTNVPWWAWALIGIGAVGTGTAIYMVGHDRGRDTAAEGPDRRGAGTPPGPRTPGG